MINIENLNKNYGNNPVLKNINLHLEAGKVYGLVGENGSGKTTLFNCIAGLTNFEGKINSDFDVLKNHIGFLLTEPYFFNFITGKEYLQLLCYAKKVKENNFEEKNIFNLPLEKYATEYSTGMKKKLALMGILLQQNDFYILDEPSNGVDIQSNILITEIILELKKLKKTVLISSHIFSVLTDVCDEIFLLKDGLIAKKVLQPEFSLLEDEMKQNIISNNIQKLQLK